MTFGEHLKFRRETCEYTQKELAEKTGLTPAAICQYEKDERIPDLKSFKKIVEAMPWKADVYLKYVEEIK